jgi:hypothetical protein
MKDGFVGYWDDEEWVHFHWAANEIGNKLAIPRRSAQAHLRKLCASGEIRAISSDERDFLEKPEPIPPSRWRDEDIAAAWGLLVAVSGNDLRNWLSHQSATPTAGGKQSRLIRLLAEMFPAGVPNRADCPREPLKAELLKRDPSLKPLDLKTLKTAIETCNRVVGNARNASVSD